MVLLKELPPPPNGKIGWPWTESSKTAPKILADDCFLPRVSIVTPSFNQSKFLEETIRSVLLQNYPNLEYFVIDGGSSDGSVAIIQKYASWLSGWVSEKDLGQGHAINKGFKKSSGEILAWINSDDTFCPNTIINLIEYFKTYPNFDIIYGECNCIDEYDQILGKIANSNFNLKKQMTGRNLLLQPSTFFKRKTFVDIGGIDVTLKYIMDYDLWVRMLISGCQIEAIPLVLSNYRIHPESKTKANQLQMRQEIRIVLDKIFLDDEIPGNIRRWKGKAYKNLYQSIGELFFSNGQMDLARQQFNQALMSQPLLPASILTLAFLFDTRFGTRLGSSIQKLVWRLRKITASNLFLEDLILKH